jgi:hypothetical protein
MSQQQQQAGPAEKKKEEKPQFPPPNYTLENYVKAYKGHGRINRLKFIGEVSPNVCGRGKKVSSQVCFCVSVVQGVVCRSVHSLFGGSEEDHQHCAVSGIVPS